MTGQSKFIDPLTISCREFLHPWTKNCANASAGMLLASIEPTLRTYVTFYLLALALRLRKPTLVDLKRTLGGILQSTAFLCTNGYGFVLWACALRHVFGRFYFLTIGFIPTFLGSLMAISIERPERRMPLALYVANVGTETLWNIFEARGWVRSIPNAQVLIFGLGITALLYLYRLGLHKSTAKDGTFKVLSFLVGKEEEGPIKPAQDSKNHSNNNVNFATISGFVHAYDRLVKAKHESCTHKRCCIPNAIIGGLKSFTVGLGIQMGLQFILNLEKVLKFRMDWRKQIFNMKNLQLGFFLGGFSFLYKTASCLLRLYFNRDDPRFAIPAGIIGSLAYFQFPNTTIALYVLWKAVQLYYNWGIELGELPEIPNFAMYLFSFFTAVLFHACILEADSLRPSYYKFLQNISGERVSRFDISKFDVFGLNSFKQHKNGYERIKIDMSSPLPRIPIIE